MEVLTPTDLQYQYTLASKEKQVSICAILESTTYALVAQQGHMAIPEKDTEAVTMLCNLVAFMEKELGSLFTKKFVAALLSEYSEEDAASLLARAAAVRRTDENEGRG